MKFCKKTLSFILAFVLLFSSITPVSAKNDTAPKKTTIKGQEVIIGDTAYYVFSTDKNAKSDLIKAHEKGKLQLEKLQGADGLEISGELNGASVGAGETEKAIPYYLNIKGSNFIGVGGKSFDWDTLPDGLELQVWYLNEDGIDVNIGSPITINESNYQRTIHMTFDIVGQPLAFGMKTNVDSETYLTDVYYTNENSPEPSTTASNDMTFDLVQVPSTNLSVKWVDVNRQQLARENTPATVLKDILTFNFIENRKFDLPNQDRDELYFRLINKVKRVEVKDMQGATALVSGKKDGEEVTLDGKIYKLTTSYDPAFNKGSKIQLMYMPDVIDRTKNPESPTPTNYVRVTIDAGEGTELAQGETKKVYDVRLGKALKAEHYPKLELLPGHKDPITWTIAPGTAINKAENILGKADKTSAEKITAANLKAVDTTALQGQELDEKFWHDGVVLADNIDATKKAEFEALLKDAKVTDATKKEGQFAPRNADTAGTFEGTLLVTFKDGSTLEVPNQKLIVKANTIKVELTEKDAQGKEKPLRDGDTVVKGKVTADATENKENGYKVPLEGLIVTVKDEKGNTIGVTLADKDGNFTAGTRELKAGEKITVSVTLPKLTKESTSEAKTVQLNPDKLNSIIPTGEAVVKNLKGKKGVDQAKVTTLETAIKKAHDDLVETDGKVKSTVTIDEKGQKSLDDQYKAIKAAIAALTENKIPEIKAPAYKEIFVGDDINLDEGVSVTDDNIKQVDGKDYSYKIYDGSNNVVEKAAMVAKDGVYRVVYSAEDAQGVKASHTMTVLVKKTVVEVPGEFPTPTPEGYVKVEFKSGKHAGLNGVSKFLVKKDSPKSVVKEPEIIPIEGYKLADPKWSVAIPETFAKDFETEAQVLAKVTTDKPADKDKDKYATLTFEKGDHGEFEQNAKTTIYVLKNEEVKFNAPGIEANEGFTFAKWEPELKTNYSEDTKHVAQYASNSDISDVPVKGFQEVKFMAGTDGHFGNDVKEKSVWVRPGKLVDLRTKAPQVTVTTKGKSFIGWDKDLVQTFTKADQPTVINAKYDDTVKTIEPTENKDKYAKVDFLAGNLGTIKNNQTTTFWVVKDAEVTSIFKVPTVTANKGWKVKTGNEAWSPEVATKYTKDTIHLAQYDYSGASVVPQKPGDEKPIVPDNFVKVEFKKGDHGVISSEETFIYWVDPTKPVTEEFKAPKVIADTNYKHIGWKPALTANQTFAQKTDIVAQYKSTVVTKDPNDENYVTVEFDAKDHGTLTGDAKFWVYKNEKVSITAPTVTAKAGYTFNKWDPAVKDSYAEPTVHNATYTTNNNISDTEVEGFNKVTFKAGAHGTLTEKSLWVKPDTLVDLNDKAPAVTPEKGYSHTGWEPGLVGKFENNTDIVAQYTEELTPEPKVTARNIGTNGPDGKRVPAVKTTVEIETEPNADVTIEYKDAQGKTKKIVAKADDQGKLTKEIQPKLDKDTEVKVTVKDGEKKAAEKTVKVFDDLDDNKIPDNQSGQTERPAALASNIGKKPAFTTITGEAEKGATVIAKVGTEVVGTATADSETGKYTIQAKQNGAPIKQGVKVDVTAILKPKTESEKQTVVVFNDTDGTGQPDSSKDFDVKKATGMQVVASPDKMVYTDGDQLNLDGLKVLITDVNGNQKIFTYNNANNDEFTKAGLSVDYKQNAKLTNDDNDKRLTVTLDTTGNTHATEAITGQTPTALTVNKNQSAQPTDVVAANQGDETVTKVKGKATKGAEIKVTDENGNNLLPAGTTIKADANGDFTADLNKLLKPGDKVIFTATEPGKSESPKAETTVIRDKDGNWKADTGSKLSTPVIDPIREKDEKVVVAAPKAEDKIQTITVEDQNGKTVKLTKDPADTTGKTWKVDGSNDTVKENNEGKLEIPVKDKLPLNDRDQIKVTFKDGENPANEAFDKAFVQKASQTPIVDQVYTGDKSVKIVDPTVSDPTAKTIKVKVGDNDSMIVEKQTDGSWKVKDDPNKEVKVEDGKIVVPLDPSAKKNDLIKVSTINDSGKASPAAKVTVVDKEKSTTPTVNPVATNDTKITGKAGPNADVVVTITPKDGSTPKEIVTKADKDGNFTVPADGLKDGDTIVAKATEKDKAPAESAPVTVGVDKSKLIKAIDDGNNALDPDKGGRNDGTPADKALEKAIEEGKKVKDNPNASQDEVNAAKDKIEKAIEDKKAYDDARDKLQEKIDEANDLKKDPEYPSKPKDVKDGLDKAATDGQTTHDDKTKTKDEIDKAIKEIQDKIDEYHKPQIGANIRKVTSNDKTVVVTVTAPNAKVEVSISKLDRTTWKTVLTPLGEATSRTMIIIVSLDETLPKGTNLFIKVTHPDYLSYENNIKVE